MYIFFISIFCWRLAGQHDMRNSAVPGVFVIANNCDIRLRRSGAKLQSLQPIVTRPVATNFLPINSFVGLTWSTLFSIHFIYGSRLTSTIKNMHAIYENSRRKAFFKFFITCLVRTDILFKKKFRSFPQILRNGNNGFIRCKTIIISGQMLHFSF